MVQSILTIVTHVRCRHTVTLASHKPPYATTKVLTAGKGCFTEASHTCSSLSPSINAHNCLNRSARVSTQQFDNTWCSKERRIERETKGGMDWSKSVRRFASQHLFQPLLQKKETQPCLHETSKLIIWLYFVYVSCKCASLIWILSFTCVCLNKRIWAL